MKAQFSLTDIESIKRELIHLLPDVKSSHRIEAMARGLLVRARPGSADPQMGDTLCLSPPLSTPEEILDRIPQILRESIIAATK